MKLEQEEIIIQGGGIDAVSAAQLIAKLLKSKTGAPAITLSVGSGFGAMINESKSTTTFKKTQQ